MNQCQTKSKEGRCKNTVFIIIKVRVFHFNSGRRTWQTWKLCFECFENFKKNPKDWFSYYPKTKKKAPVIEYKILS